MVLIFRTCRFLCLLHLASTVLLHSHVDAIRFRSMIAKPVVDKICKQTQDPNFCQTHLGNDPRTRTAADMNVLAKVAVSITVEDLQQSIDRIHEIGQHVNDPVGKRRLRLCETNYNSAVNLFNQAFRLIDSRSYMEVLFRIRDGTNKVIECENSYRRNPRSKSPLTAENVSLFKLSEIDLIIVDGLLRK